MPERCPDPRVLATMCDQLVSVLTGGSGLSLADEYAWLHPSGYRRPKGENHQRTRREVAGATGTLADGFDELDTVRHHLSAAAAGVQKALDALRGSRAALVRAERVVEGQARHLNELVANDPLPAAPPDKGALATLHDAQDRRAARAAGAPVERGTARTWIGGKPVEEPLRPSTPSHWTGEESHG